MGRRLTASGFLSQEEQDRIKAAIAATEAACSAEVRLCLETALPKETQDPELRARQVFEQLGMHATEAHNGVLFYLAVKSRRFAVLGDEDLHRRVGEGFWQDVIAGMTGHFREDRFGDGLCAGIAQVGERLAEYYPHRPDDRNELSDEIDFKD
ncbi:MAG: TPM domain-containing protein [Calditrichaeota bacterium]|nr:TPM domain-containing protein [Candidatus Cloacimonadota bacterium]MCB1046883.1 TPM domain-containing protein [Calditrichota bacterium]